MAKGWGSRAQCTDIGDGRFYDEEMHDELVVQFCTPCPVRRECLASSLLEEGTSPSKHRFGTRAALTPAQRYSVYKRDCPNCPRCGWAIDPLCFITGDLVCASCKWACAVQPIPLDGDGWQDRHSTLAVEIVAWMVANVAVQDKMPSPHALSKTLANRKEDVSRVYQALVFDQTLEQRGPHYYRVGKTTAMKVWHPPHLTTGV